MLTTVSLKPVSCGTELSIVQEGIPEVIPPEMCYLGWQDRLRCWRNSLRLRFQPNRAVKIWAAASMF